jgi:hypothetical protein
MYEHLPFVQMWLWYKKLMRYIDTGVFLAVLTARSYRDREIKENDGGVNLTKIYYKHFCKCHSVSPVQQ